MLDLLTAGLSIMAVDDEHQRRGVGTSLMRWGIDIADELDAEVCVYGTNID
jgi:predicted N-acetyltransferase YhbS